MKDKEIRTLKLTMRRDKYLVVMEAIKKAQKEARKEGQEISDSRALEFVAISYINEL